MRGFPFPFLQVLSVASGSDSESKELPDSDGPTGPRALLRLALLPVLRCPGPSAGATPRLGGKERSRQAGVKRAHRPTPNRDGKMQAHRAAHVPMLTPSARLELGWDLLRLVDSLAPPELLALLHTVSG